MKHVLRSSVLCALLSALPLQGQTLFFDDFEHGVSRDTSGGTWHRFNDGSFFGDPQWLDAYNNHNHTPGGVLSARAVEADPWVYNSYADFGATDGPLRATVYLFEDMTYVPPYEDHPSWKRPYIRVANMFSLWGDSATGPESYSDYIQIGIAPTWPGGALTYSFRTKYNDDNSLGIVDTGVPRKDSGWLELAIEVDSVADGGQVRFFIDDVPVGTSQRSGPDLRWVMMGGTKYTYENYWYDDISVLQADGDYNGDGNTDAADYVVWRKTNPNNLDGYTTWRENFGTTPAAAGSNIESHATAIPEPSTTIFVVCGLAFLPPAARRARNTAASVTVVL